MGDTATHDEIYHSSVKSVLSPALPGKDGDAIFFEVGNYLTDVSQLRDPFAHFLGKIAIWKEQKRKWPRWQWLREWLLYATNADQYLDDLMGTGEKPYEGCLANWFKEFIFAVALEKFRERPQG